MFCTQDCLALLVVKATVSEELPSGIMYSAAKGRLCNRKSACHYEYPSSATDMSLMSHLLQGQVSVQHAFATVGSKSVVASYDGSADLVYLASTSPPVVVQVMRE